MNDRSNEALLARRAIAERATPGPWMQVIRPSELGDGSFFDCVKIGGGDFPTALYYPDEDGYVGDTQVQDMKDANSAHISANSPEVIMADIDEILRLRAEVERLNKEADWLAEKCQAVCELSPCRPCSDCCPISPSCDDYPFLAKYQHMRDGTPYQCWREAARKAVEETA